MKIFINVRYGILIAWMLIIVLSYIPGVSFSGSTEPTPTSTPTPAPTPTACCGEGYHQEPTYADPKVGTLGVMTDVEVFGDTCLEYIDGTEYIYQEYGGNDRDVCVKDEGTGAYEYDVDEYFTWWGDGHVSLLDDSIFYFTPSAPSEPDYCDTHLITAYSNDTGDCNVGDEQKSGAIFVNVWKKHQIMRSKNWFQIVLVYTSGTEEPLPYGVTGNAYSIYWASNGDIKGIEQRVDATCNSMLMLSIWGSHFFDVNGGPSYQTPMTSYGSYCISNDTHSFDYDYYTSMGGLNSRFDITIQLWNSAQYGSSRKIIEIPLDAPRCCEN